MGNVMGTDGKRDGNRSPRLLGLLRSLTRHVDGWSLLVDGLTLHVDGWPLHVDS